MDLMSNENELNELSEFEFPNFKDHIEAEFVDLIFNVSEAHICQMANVYLDLGITHNEIDCVDINGVATDLMLYLNKKEKEDIIKTYNYYQKL